MISVLAFFSLLISIPIFVTSAPLRDDSWNSTNSSISILADRHRGIQHRGSKAGDTLNVTRCYCASTDWENDNVFGYYYRWDYYNVHANLNFRMERICQSGDKTRAGFLAEYQIMCLRPRRNEKDCMHDSHGNKFCYHYSGRERFDLFSFNGQNRGIPVNSPVAIHESPGRVYATCQSLCRERVGPYPDMDILYGRSMRAANLETPDQDWFHNSDNEWSHIAYYPEIDDMCHGCR